MSSQICLKCDIGIFTLWNWEKNDVILRFKLATQRVNVKIAAYQFVPNFLSYVSAKYYLCDFFTEIGRFAFLRPSLGDLGATYDDHLRLIGKRVVDFLLALIELFFARCYGWGATSDYRFKIGDFAPTGAVWPKISGIRGRPHQPSFFLEN